MQNVDVLVRLGGPTALPIDSVHFDPEVAPGDLLPWQQNVLTALAEMGAPADYAACAFGALGQPIGELPAGTLAIRYTLAGEHLWLACPTLSYKGGQLGGQTSVLGNYAPPASKESKTPMLGNPLVLGLGKQLAMAVGKSLLKRESPELYEKVFGKELDDISRELTALKDDLKQYLDNMRREMYAQKQHDDFFEVVYWFVQEYKGTMRTHLLGEEVDGDRQHKLLEKNRGDLLVLAGKMQLQLELDQEVDDCTYQARRKVELYRLVGLNYLLLLGEQLYWQRLLAKDEKNSATTTSSENIRTSRGYLRGRYAKCWPGLRMGATRN